MAPFIPVGPHVALRPFGELRVSVVDALVSEVWVVLSISKDDELRVTCFRFLFVSSVFISSFTYNSLHGSPLLIISFQSLRFAVVAASPGH
jgi:hypothetical protein